MNARKPTTFKLSKSRLMQHQQCPRRLWLFTHQPSLINAAPRSLFDATRAVANGGMAKDAYLEIIYPETAGKQKLKLRQDLLDCSVLDTYGLVRLVERLVQGQAHA